MRQEQIFKYFQHIIVKQSFAIKIRALHIETKLKVLL